MDRSIISRYFTFQLTLHHTHHTIHQFLHSFILMMSSFQYLSGFGSHFSSEHPDYPDALPKNQNSPQKCAYGLYAEQLSGTAFTAPRSENQRTWFYRIRPSVMHEPFLQHNVAKCLTSNWGQQPPNPNQMRWLPFKIPDATESINFVQGLHSLCGAGSPRIRHGIAIHMYLCNASMENSTFYNSDGDFLIGKCGSWMDIGWGWIFKSFYCLWSRSIKLSTLVVPQKGTLDITTEFGKIKVAPNEICVIQQGMKFTVDINEPSRWGID